MIPIILKSIPHIIHTTRLLKFPSINYHSTPVQVNIHLGSSLPDGTGIHVLFVHSCHFWYKLVQWKTAKHISSFVSIDSAIYIPCQTTSISTAIIDNKGSKQDLKMADMYCRLYYTRNRSTTDLECSGSSVAREVWSCPVHRRPTLWNWCSYIPQSQHWNLHQEKYQVMKLSSTTTQNFENGYSIVLEFSYDHWATQNYHPHTQAHNRLYQQRELFLLWSMDTTFTNLKCVFRGKLFCVSN